MTELYITAILLVSAKINTTPSSRKVFFKLCREENGFLVYSGAGYSVIICSRMTESSLEAAVTLSPGVMCQGALFQKSVLPLVSYIEMLRLCIFCS